MASPIAATGLGSNLDVTGLVTKLMEVERKPLEKLDAKAGAATVKISAYASFRGALSGFQGTLKALAEPTNYQIAKGTVADTAVATASATGSADVGSYSLEVTNLAKSQKLTSGVYSAVTDPVGTGVITIQYGTYDADNASFALNGQKGSQTITIDPAHSSLAGVRDAINAAKVGVTASIVNDGTGFRLIMSAKDTGAANSLKVSVSDNDLGNSDAAGLSRLAYDPTAAVGAGKNMSQLIGAEDARLIIDGLPISKSSNVISDAIAGTTLTLTKTNIGSPTKLTVAADTTAAQTSVENFVKSYNELNKTIKDLTRYDAGSRTAAALQGDATVRAVASDIRNGLTAMVSGSSGSYKALPQVGLSFDKDGVLKLDATKLQNALASDPVAVQGLFSSAGKTDDSLVSYAGSTATSKAGNYALMVSQLGTRGSVTGSAAAGLMVDGTNDTLNLSVNGKATTIALAQKSYADHTALMAELQSKINGSTSLATAGFTVSLSEASGVLTLGSTKWGSASTVSITGGNAAENLFGLTPTTVAGVDVAGTLGGALATGAGQRLTGTGAADGLKLDIAGGATGARGTLSYGVGVAGQLDQMITKLLSSKGLIATKSQSLQSQVDAITADRERMTLRLDAVEKRYTTQFNSLDQQLSASQSTSAYLAQQLAAISNSLR